MPRNDGVRLVPSGEAPILMASLFCSCCRMSIAICNIGDGRGFSYPTSDKASQNASHNASHTASDGDSSAGSDADLVVPDHKLGDVRTRVIFVTSSANVADHLIHEILEHAPHKVASYSSIAVQY